MVPKAWHGALEVLTGQVGRVAVEENAETVSQKRQNETERISNIT